MDEQYLSQLNDFLTTNTDKPDETPASTLRALYIMAAGKRYSARLALSSPLPKLDEKETLALSFLVKKRCSGVPLAHITGRQNFMGIEMLAGPEAMIPRAETELLGYEILKLSTQLQKVRSSITILDICTGSGNIVLGVVYHLKACKAFGSDISPDAIGLARRNAQFAGLSDRVDFRISDLFEGFDSAEFRNNVDIISCNPPYISTSKISALSSEISQYEPHQAFDGGTYGLNILSRVIREAPKYLKSDSFLCLEVGLGQGQFVTRMINNSKFYRDVRLVENSASEVRVLIAQT